MYLDDTNTYIPTHVNLTTHQYDNNGNLLEESIQIDKDRTIIMEYGLQ